MDINGYAWIKLNKIKDWKIPRFGTNIILSHLLQTDPPPPIGW